MALRNQANASIDKPADSPKGEQDGKDSEGASNSGHKAADPVVTDQVKEEDEATDPPYRDVNNQNIARKISQIDDVKLLKEIASALFMNKNISKELLLEQFVQANTFKPSEYWLGRDKNSPETPVEFIQRVYGSQLDGNFTKADLRKYDKPLVKQLYQWARSHQSDPALLSLNLPTKAERNTSILNAGELQSDPYASASAKRKMLQLSLHDMEAASKLSSVRRMRKSRASSKSDVPFVPDISL